MTQSQSGEYQKLIMQTLRDLEARLDSSGFESEEPRLDAEIRKRKALPHWDQKPSFFWCHIDIDFCGPEHRFALRVRFGLVGSDNIPEQGQEFLAYPSVDEILPRILKGLEAMSKLALVAAFQDGRWEEELWHWYTMGYVTGRRKLRCLRILVRDSLEKPLTYASMNFVNDTLMGPKVEANKKAARRMR